MAVNDDFPAIFTLQLKDSAPNQRAVDIGATRLNGALDPIKYLIRQINEFAIVHVVLPFFTLISLRHAQTHNALASAVPDRS